ncbi:MAG: hypothetical protein QMC36_04395 [Patescibacteria group bacterium]
MRFAMADAPEGETPEEAEKRKSLLKQLQKENRLTAAEFFAKYSEHAEYFAKILDKRAQAGDYGNAGCENFAAWLRNKALSGASFKNSVASERLADEARKLAREQGPGGKVSESLQRYGEAITQGEKL